MKAPKKPCGFCKKVRKYAKRVFNIPKRAKK